jgi:hypothetical protein
MKPGNIVAQKEGIIAMINTKLFIFLALFITGSLKAQPEGNPICLATHCGGELLSCGFDQDCRQWLQCVLECGDDKIRCPSVCGFYFQGQSINRTSQCIFKSQCVNLGFDTLKNYEHGSGTPLAGIDGIDGTWWFAGSYGGHHIFDFDCQRFDFKRKDSKTLDVRFSVPLTFNGAEKLTQAQGKFRVLPTGALEVAYDNFAGYHENWYVLDQTASTLLAHVCISNPEANPPRCYEYGTILLARQPLDAMDQDLFLRLDALTTRYLGFEMGSMRPTRIERCPQSEGPSF